MKFYAYKGLASLGDESLGTEGKAIWKDLKTVRGAIRRASKLWGQDFSLFTFINFYDDKTFRRVY